jgi:Ser/Thr protein kinase RdoA (MazF antagonist)
VSSPPREMDEAAALAIGRFDVDVVATTFVSSSENIVYRVDTRDGHRYALRVHRPGYHSIAELESENAWTRALSTAGVETPRPVPTRDGGGYATVPYGEAGETRYVGLIEWLEGEPMTALLDHGDPGLVAACARLGELIARMHLQTEAFVPPPGFARHRLDVDGLIGDDPWWGPFWHVPEFSEQERQLVLKVRDGMRRRLAAYGTGSGVFGLIHADLLPDNVLVRSDGVVAAIDFDDAAFGYRVYDIAVPLTGLTGEPHFEELHDALLTGYQRHRPLTAEDLSLLPMFRLIRCLVEIGWFDSRLAGYLTYNRGTGGTREGLITPLVGQALVLIEQVLPVLDNT